MRDRISGHVRVLINKNDGSQELLLDQHNQIQDGYATILPNLHIGTTCKALFLRFQKAMRLAGIPQWGKFFQNMRSTRETELHSLGYSLKDVCDIIGNTPSVAMKHYLQTSVDLIKKASELVTNSDVISAKNMESNLESNLESNSEIEPQMESDLESQV